MNRKKDSPLSDIEKFCIDSLIINGNVDMAYKLSHPNSKEGDYVHVLALRWQRSDLVKAYINEMHSKVLFVGDKTKQQKQDLKIDYTERNNLIQALSDAANSENDTIRRTKILSELADLQRMDKDDNKNDEQRVHFYLPLNCKRCKLYVDELKRRDEKLKLDK